LLEVRKPFNASFTMAVSVVPRSAAAAFASRTNRLGMFRKYIVAVLLGMLLTSVVMIT
jgi:hypothetical protein